MANRLLGAESATYIGLDKGRYPVNIILISLQKHMLWVAGPRSLVDKRVDS